MYRKILFTLSVIIWAGCAHAQRMSMVLPSARSCGATYSDVIKPYNWVCEDSQFQTYPRASIDALLKTPEYEEIVYQSKITANCMDYEDHNSTGINPYYTYQSICKMNRKPIRVIWAEVPHYTVPNNLKSLNGGLLPCHVLNNQHLYDVECVHPWVNGLPGTADLYMRGFKKRMDRAIKRGRLRFSGAKRHLCLVGYNYNINMVCRPTGFMTREVLVYSEHANRIFSARVDNVPTACACTYCKCNSHKGKSPLIVK